MTRSRRLKLAVPLIAVLTLALPSAAAAQITANRTIENPLPPRALPDQPAYAVDQFRGDRLQRIRALIAKGDYQKARLALDGNRNQIRTSEGEYLLGVVSANLGSYEAASEAFRSSLSLDRNHIGASLGAALTDLRLGRRDRAEAIARTLEARRASCGARCGDKAALDRASQLLQHFLGKA